MNHDIFIIFNKIVKHGYAKAIYAFVLQVYENAVHFALDNYNVNILLQCTYIYLILYYNSKQDYTNLDAIASSLV